MSHAAALFRSRPWHALRPDTAHHALVAGHGDGGADDGVQAALTEDGGTLIAYLPPEQRVIDVDLTRLAGARVQAHWFDPRGGAAVRVSGAPFERAGVKRFVAPGRAGVVLVLDDQARGYPAPGQPEPLESTDGPGRLRSRSGAAR